MGLVWLALVLKELGISEWYLASCDTKLCSVTLFILLMAQATELKN
jgi:hypothetical protein